MAHLAQPQGSRAATLNERVGNLARPLLRPLLARSAPLLVPAKLALGGALLVALGAAGRRIWR